MGIPNALLTIGKWAGPIIASAATDWISGKIQTANQKELIEAERNNATGTYGSNEGNSHSEGSSYGAGSSSSSSVSDAEAGTNDDTIGAYLKQFYDYNDTSLTNQAKNNRTNMIMQMGYNTLGAITQGIYNHIENQASMNYNSAEATANREFQREMSNTSYQRAVEDMRKAGINPILAFSSGAAGASTPSGAQGTASNASMGLMSGTTLGNSVLGGTVPSSYYSKSHSESSASSEYFNIASQIMDSVQSGRYDTKWISKMTDTANELAQEGIKAASQGQVKSNTGSEAGNDRKDTANLGGGTYKPGKNPYTGG